MKKYNFNEYGRFKGGFPDKLYPFRGNSTGLTGTFHDLSDLRESENDQINTDFKITRSDVTEYGSYAKDDMDFVKQKMTYIRGEIVENYFTTNKFTATAKIIAFMMGTSMALQLIKTYYEEKVLPNKKWVDL